MEYRSFGNADWMVSALGLGTVELGMRYGFYRRAEPLSPSRSEAVDLILTALQSGVNFLDTAPTYGTSEALIGDALSRWNGEVHVATKIFPESRLSELDESLRRLRLARVDLLQVHNCSTRDLSDAGLLKRLERAKGSGKTRLIGVTVYDEGTAVAAADTGIIDTVQLPFNLLDNRVKRVFPHLRDRGVEIIARSPLLKGVLTARRSDLPKHLAPLARAAGTAEGWFHGQGISLVEGALRFCLSQPMVSTVLIGVRNLAELKEALGAESQTRFDLETMHAIGCLSGLDPHLLDPRNWEEDTPTDPD